MVGDDGDTNPNQSKLQVGDKVKIVDPFVATSGYESYITDAQWGRQYFKNSWAYQIHPYRRYFGPWQLKKIVRE